MAEKSLQEADILGSSSDAESGEKLWTPLSSLTKYPILWGSSPGFQRDARNGRSLGTWNCSFQFF